MHTITEEHYAHRIEVSIRCSNPEAALSVIPLPVYAFIVYSLAENTREGTFEENDCYEHTDEKRTAHYSGSWRIVEPSSNQNHA